MLRIEVTTPDCAEGEVYAHVVSGDTDKGNIMLAIETLYPDAISIWMGAEEE